MFNVCMSRTIANIRRSNMMILLAEAGGSKQLLAEKGGTAPTYISQILTTDTDKRRNIGESLARKFEEGFLKPKGWMDVDHPEDVGISYDFDEISVDSINAEIDREIDWPGSDYVQVHYGSFKLSAGVVGFAIDYEEEQLKPLYYRKDWLQSEGLKVTSLTARKITGESMCPGLCDGDVVLVDTSKQTPIDGKVFAVNYEGEMVIKRMMRDQGQWWLTSDNPNKTLYPNKLCAGEMCIIIGQIVHKQSTNI